MSNFHDLHELFVNDPKAKQYFNNLPDKIRAQVARAGGLNSYEGMKSYAENLMRWPE